MTTGNETTSILPTWVLSWAHFVKAHEKLVLILVGALVLWHYGDVVRSHFDDKHLAEQSQTNQQIAKVEAQNQALVSQLAQMQKSYEDTIAALNAKIDAKKQQVIIQQKKDDVMPPVQLSARWSELIQVPETNIVPQSNGTIAVSEDAAHLTVNQLENLPQLKEEIVDTNTKLTACTNLSAEKDTAIAGLKDQIGLEKKGREEDAKVAKDKQRKSFWKGTKFGSILTAVGIVALKVVVVAVK